MEATPVIDHARQEWQERWVALQAEQEAGWEERYKPGSFGCHELLDRVLLAGDWVEGQVLEHPACVLNAEWYRLAAQAVATLRELYQRVGADHLAAEGPARGTDRTPGGS